MVLLSASDLAALESRILEGMELQRIFQAQETRRRQLMASTSAERKARLVLLRDALDARRGELLAALGKDLGKPPEEAYLTEVLPTFSELNHAIRQVDRWMKPRQVGTPLALLGTRSRIHLEPKGRVLILAPWNYPAFLILTPLIAALAAGNTVILKPSEKTPATEAFLVELIRSTFREEDVAIVTGGPEVAERLLQLPFDHIFFTGSTRVGKLVMAAAAQHLASVTLELGGKSPAVITESADLAQAARRIAWGKWINAGQTCVAPDYVLVPASREQPFLEALVGSVKELFGPEPLTSGAYGNLVDAAALERQKALLASSGGEIVQGGRWDETGLEPTIVRGAALDSPLMTEEIFGPILPVIAYTTHAEAQEILRNRDQPLASYFFTRDKAEAEGWIRATRAGGTVVNHAVIHLGNPNLPFGGRGPSGMGAYHGQYGFDTFSHSRAVLEAGWWDTVGWTFPPYGGALKKRIFKALRWLE